MRIKIATFILLITILSCQENNDFKKTETDNLEKVRLTTLTNESHLIPILSQAGFFKRDSKLYSSARSSSSNYQIVTDSILKVLQSDSTNYTYTFKVDEESPVNAFENLILKKVSGGYLGFILRYESDDSQFNNLPIFNGKIKRFDLEGTLLSEQILVNGNLVSNNNTNGRTAKDCSEAIRFAFEAYDGTPCENLWDDFDDGCYLVIYIEECNSGGGGSGGGGGGSDPGFPSDPGGGTYIPDPVGGGGGGGGSGNGGGSGSSGGGPSGGSSGSGSGTVDPGYEGEDPIGVLPVKPKLTIAERIDKWEEEQIDTVQLKPCMQTIVTDLKNLTQGSVGQIIQKFSGSVPGYNWELKDGPLTGGQNAFTNQAYNKTTGTVTTTFDGSKFTSATDLSIARTILHESIHAFLIAYFRVDPLSARSSYPDLVNDYAQQVYGGDANQIQHAEFVRNFVNDIAIALEEYGKNKGYTHTTQFYQDLAWGGLTHTGTYDALGNPIETTWFQSSVPSSTDRKRIVDTITIEQTGKDFSGTTKTQKGTNAGC